MDLVTALLELPRDLLSRVVRSVRRDVESLLQRDANLYMVHFPEFYGHEPAGVPHDRIVAGLVTAMMGEVADAEERMRRCDDGKAHNGGDGVWTEQHMDASVAYYLASSWIAREDIMQAYERVETYLKRHVNDDVSSIDAIDGHHSVALVQLLRQSLGMVDAYAFAVLGGLKLDPGELQRLRQQAERALGEERQQLILLKESVDGIEAESRAAASMVDVQHAPPTIALTPTPSSGSGAKDTVTAPMPMSEPSTRRTGSKLLTPPRSPSRPMKPNRSPGATEDPALPHSASWCAPHTLPSANGGLAGLPGTAPGGSSACEVTDVSAQGHPLRARHSHSLAGTTMLGASAPVVAPPRISSTHGAAVGRALDASPSSSSPSPSSSSPLSSMASVVSQSSAQLPSLPRLAALQRTHRSRTTSSRVPANVLSALAAPAPLCSMLHKRSTKVSGLHQGPTMRRAASSSDTTPWKPRWFVLANAKLTYYRNRDSADPSGCIPLLVVSSIGTSPRNGRHAFEVRAGRGQAMQRFCFRAKDERECHTWLFTLQRWMAALSRRIFGLPSHHALTVLATPRWWRKISSLSQGGDSEDDLSVSDGSASSSVSQSSSTSISVTSSSARALSVSTGGIGNQSMGDGDATSAVQSFSVDVDACVGRMKGDGDDDDDDEDNNDDCVDGADTDGCAYTVVTASCRGHRPTMEDAHVIHPFHGDDCGDVVFFGVFDGHGGPEAAKHCARCLPQHVEDLWTHVACGSPAPCASTATESERVLVERMAGHGEHVSARVRHAVCQAFGRTEHQFRMAASGLIVQPVVPFAATAVDDDDVDVWSGSTAVTAVLTGNPLTLVVANLGDSRAVLCRRGHAVALSMDHKPNEACEQQRIERAGGWVERRRDLNTSSLWRLNPNLVVNRSTLPKELGDAVGFTETHRLLGELAVSRAVGDLEYKGQLKHECFDCPTPSARFAADLVSTTPDVVRVHVRPGAQEDAFVLLACDGLWDVMTNQEVVTFIRARLGFEVVHDDDDDGDGIRGDHESATSSPVSSTSSKTNSSLRFSAPDTHSLSTGGDHHGVTTSTVKDPLLSVNRLRQVVDALCREALRRGSFDNISIMLIWLGDALPQEVDPRQAIKRQLLASLSDSM